MRRCARREPRGAVHPERAADAQERRRAGRDSVLGLPGTAWADAAVGERAPRQGIPLGHGPPSDRRHLQRRRRRALPMEGFGPERARNPALGGRGHGQRPAAMGGEVLRRALRPSLAVDGRAHLRLALRPRALPAQRSAAGAGRAPPLGADGGELCRASPSEDRHEDHVLGMYQALVEARIPFELVHEAFLDPGGSSRSSC